ncbi:MAG TPA: hypothetical protein P5121_28500 [Caldilineaceae bacterium]|nr:hypothetical protein [Caldilineaceae bacterium]
MATLQCYLLGPPRFACDNCVIKIQRHKAQALLIYLAVTRTVQARATLAALLWPEHNSRQALAAWRRHLSELNSTLGSSWLAADHETIRCAPNTAIWLDINDFAQQLAACATHDHAQDAVCPACITPLTAAVARYCDDFLAGFTLPDAPAFDEWQFFQREALRQQLAGALDRLV